MASPSGFEPLAFRLGGGRSIQLSYGDRRVSTLILPVSRRAVNPYLSKGRCRRAAALFLNAWQCSLKDADTDDVGKRGDLIHYSPTNLRAQIHDGIRVIAFGFVAHVFYVDAVFRQQRGDIGQN